MEFESNKYSNLTVNGETAIKPYYYLRNGLLHVRYTVDRCVELTEDETKRLIAKIRDKPWDKQGVLSEAWSFYADCVGKPIIRDGITEVEKRIKEYNVGHTDKISDIQ